jgi:hypothetical protein
METWTWNGQTGVPSRPYCHEHGRFFKADGTCPRCQADASAKAAALAAEVAERSEMLGLP